MPKRATPVQAALCGGCLKPLAAHSIRERRQCRGTPPEVEASSGGSHTQRLRAVSDPKPALPSRRSGSAKKVPPAERKIERPAVIGRNRGESRPRTFDIPEDVRELNRQYKRAVDRGVEPTVEQREGHNRFQRLRWAQLDPATKRGVSERSQYARTLRGGRSPEGRARVEAALIVAEQHRDEWDAAVADLLNRQAGDVG